MPPKRAARSNKRTEADDAKEVLDEPTKRSRVQAEVSVPAPSSPIEPPSAPNWAMLPADIWRKIFVFIPLRPRIVVISVLCRRFVPLVRSTISSLPMLSEKSQQLALSLLPVVTSLESLQRKISPPASLKQLSIKLNSVLPSQVTHLTSLSSLHLAMENNVTAVALLTNNAASLESLEFSFTEMGMVLNVAKSIQFPMLRSLSLAYTAGSYWTPSCPTDLASALSSIIYNHASQLTKLVIVGCSSINEALDLTRLQRLEFLHLADVYPSVIAKLPPSINSLILEPVWSAERHIIETVGDHLVGFRCQNHHYSAKKALFSTLLERCTRLTQLTVNDTQSIEVLRGFRSITRLCLGSPPTRATLFQFPNLTELDVTLLGKWKPAFSILRKVVATHPTLKYLKCHMHGFRQEVQLADEFLQYAEEAEVESVAFRFNPELSGPMVPQLKAAIRKRLWLTVVWTEVAKSRVKNLID